MKLYFVKYEYIVNAERYLDKLKYYIECEFDKYVNEYERICEDITKLLNALDNAKGNAIGYRCRANWNDYSIIKNANDTRELMDLML